MRIVKRQAIRGASIPTTASIDLRLPLNFTRSFRRSEDDRRVRRARDPLGPSAFRTSPLAQRKRKVATMTACPGPDRRRLIKRSIRDRFEDRYVVSADGCFIWTGATNRSTGYGSIGVRRKVHYAHRIAYELYVGPIPKGLVI